MMTSRFASLCLSLSLLAGTACPASGFAEITPVEPSVLSPQQSMNDAWWTGPMLANSAETLPPGHFLFEPYVYDVRSPNTNAFGSQAYLIYGLADRLSVALIPTIGYNQISNGPNSSGIGLGDWSMQAQYRLTEFQPGSWMPTTAIQLRETFPTGQYDQLGRRPSDGLGSGTYTTSVALNSQMYFWLPNGRILRMRFDVSDAFSRRTRVKGVSVYGTGDTFLGSAKPGNAFFADLAFEYSLTQRWVLATDFTYSHNGNTRVTGFMDPSNLPYPLDVRTNSGSSTSFGVAPAIEYNWTPAIGVLLGTRIIFGGHHSTGSVTPVIALNYVH
jgi:hypothetical protein